MKKVMCIVLSFLVSCSMTNNYRYVASHDKKFELKPQSAKAIKEIDLQLLKAFTEVFKTNQELIPEIYNIDTVNNGLVSTQLFKSMNSAAGLFALAGAVTTLYAGAVIVTGFSMAPGGSLGREAAFQAGSFGAALGVVSLGIAYSMKTKADNNVSKVSLKERRDRMSFEINKIVDYYSNVFSLDINEVKQFRRDVETLVIRENKKSFSEGLSEWYKKNNDSDYSEDMSFDILSLFEKSPQVYTQDTLNKVSALRALETHLLNNPELVNISKEKYREMLNQSNNDTELTVKILNLKSKALDSLKEVVSSDTDKVSEQQKKTLEKVIEEIDEILSLSSALY